MKIRGSKRMRQTGDTTEDPGRSIRSEGKEDETEGFPEEDEAESFPVEVEGEGLVEDGEEGSAEDEVVEVEVGVDFPVVVEDVADAAAVVENLKTEADLRKEGKIGDVVSVASTTIPTGRTVTGARTPSQMFLHLPRPTPWTTPGIRSSK